MPIFFRLQIKGEFMRVGIATDHGGFGLKRKFVAPLECASHRKR
jgi:hypothetical protein